MKLGFIQPGRLGDLIIMLPAVKRLSEEYDKVIWPVLKPYAQMLQEAAPYVDIIGIDTDISRAVPAAYSCLEGKVDVIKDTACGLKGSILSTRNMYTHPGYVFDKFKYDALGLPLDLKWTLPCCINRNYDAEDKLFKSKVKSESYCLVHLESSRGRSRLRPETVTKLPIVEVTAETSLFYWIKVIENASEIICVDSCVANLIEQLNLNHCPKSIVRKPHRRGKYHQLPTLINEWAVI